MQFIFSLYKGFKYYVRFFFVKRVNDLGELGLYFVFYFICFYYIFRLSVINKFIDIELIFFVILKLENNDWLFVIFVLV